MGVLFLSPLYPKTKPVTYAANHTLLLEDQCSYHDFGVGKNSGKIWKWSESDTKFIRKGIHFQQSERGSSISMVRMTVL
jgi:hypothetical protein